MAFPSVYEMTNSLTPVTQSSTKTYDQQADGDFVDIWNTNPYIAIKVIAGSTAIDTWIEKINMKLYKTGTPAGSAYIRVWDANNNVVESIEFIPNTHLTTTSTVYSFYLPKPIQLKVNYKVGLQYNGSTSSSNRINARYTPSGTTQSGFSVSTSTNLDAGLTNRNVYMTFDANATGTALMTNRRRQHFWEYFSGSTLNSRWTLEQLVGGDSTLVMSDTVDGGAIFTNQSTSNRVANFHFNNKRQYDYNGSVFIWVAQRSSATSLGILLDIGLNGTTGQSSTDSILFRQYDDGSSFIGALSKSATAESTTATDVATNSNMQVLKCAVDASNAIYSINGVTKVTKTTNLPTAKMQPKIRMDNTTQTGLRTVNIRYCEAYNT